MQRIVSCGDVATHLALTDLILAGEGDKQTTARSSRVSLR